MSWKTNVLVVANVTADSDELMADLERRAAEMDTFFTLVIPPRVAGAAGRERAEGRLRSALGRARERGLEIEGTVGDSDPVLAVTDVFDPRRFDEIVVSTLPARVSRWLMIGLPQRIARLTGVPVHHVVGSEERAPEPTVRRPAPEHRGVLAPLTPLTWGRRQGEERTGRPARPARTDAGAA